MGTNYLLNVYCLLIWIFFTNFSRIVFYPGSDYPVTVVGIENFDSGNPLIVGEAIENNISNDWYIIANGHNSQYITIDLASDRLGRCYDRN